MEVVDGLIHAEEFEKKTLRGFSPKEVSGG